MKRLRVLLPLIAILAIPTLAHAHPGHDGHDFGWDFNTGFAHPLLGWDHLIAMLAVGLWAAQLGGRARWLVPATFVSVMTLGALFARSGVPVPGVEQTIAASVLVLGLLVAFSAKLPTWSGTAIVGVFAAFHGFAHGAEMPLTSAGLIYGAGFIAATALIHAAGVGLGSFAVARQSEKLTRVAGWAIAACGVALFAI